MDVEVAETNPPVIIRGQVSSLPYRTDLHGGFFMVNDEAGIFISVMDRGLIPARNSFRVGDYVEVKGHVVEGHIYPHVVAAELVRIGSGELPPPPFLDASELMAPELDCARVAFEGLIVRTFPSSDRIERVLEVQIGERQFHILVPFTEEMGEFARQSIGREARFEGIAVTKSTPHRQLAARLFRVTSTDDVTFLEEKQPIPTEIKDVLRSRATSLPRVRVEGTVIAVNGTRAFLGEGDYSLELTLKESTYLSQGERVEVIGHVRPDFFSPNILVDVLTKFGTAEVPAAVPFPTFTDVPPMDLHGHLVEMEARVTTTLRDGRLTCAVEDHLVEVIPPPGAEIPQIGSVISLVGVCFYETTGGLTVWDLKPDTISIVVDRSEQLDIVAKPPFFSRRRTLQALLIASVVILALGFFTLFLRRKVEEQTKVIREKVEQAASLEERERVARELHDSFAQNLTGLSLQLSTIDSLAPKETGRGFGESLALAKRMLRHCQTETRDAIFELRKERASDTPLEQLIDPGAHAGFSGSLEVETVGEAWPLQRETRHQVLRILNEALRNAIAHGRPDNILVRFNYTSTALVLTVENDGLSFDVSAPQPVGHFGLIGMQERARKIDADLNISSTEGEVTRVTLTVPKPST